MRTPEDTLTDADQLIRYGTIASVDLDAGTIVVDLDDDSQTPAIRWFELAMGRKKTWVRPVQGEQVMLFCPAGEVSAAVALRGLASNAFPKPGDEADDLVTYEDGAKLSYDMASHTLTYALPAGATFKVTAPGGTTIDGPLHCTGAITSDGDMTAQGDVKAGSISLKSHKHSGVAAGSAQSGGPVA